MGGEREALAFGLSTPSILSIAAEGRSATALSPPRKQMDRQRACAMFVMAPK